MPFEGTLLPHQETGVAFLKAHDRAILADDPGLGKTIQVLAALPDPPVPTLVVCPAGVVTNWEREIAKFRPDYRGVTRVVSWSGLPVEPAPYLVLDEVHYAKNPWQAHRAKAAMFLARQAEVCWGLSGTPLPNEIKDLWGIFLTMGIARRITARAFQEAIVWRGDTPVGVTPAFTGVIAPFVLRRTKHELDLPEKHRAPEVVLLSTRSAPRSLQALERAKVLWLLENESRFDHPLIAFVRFRRTVEYLESQPGWTAIHGGVPRTKRQAIVDAFQTGRFRAIALTSAGAEGITLTRARTLVRVTLNWTPATNLQVEDRLHRIGLDHEVRVLDLVVDCPLERHLHTRLKQKRRVMRQAGF